MAIQSLKKWVAGETFTARSYVYERDQIVNEVNRLAGLLTGSSDLTVNTLTANNIVTDELTIDGKDLNDYVRGVAVYTSNDAPTDQMGGDLWFDNN